jgi:hypothetical protein
VCTVVPIQNTGIVKEARVLVPSKVIKDPECKIRSEESMEHGELLPNSFFAQFSLP